MPFDKAVQRIAIAGTGMIGASWAAQYLARGFDVIATDPAPNAEALKELGFDGKQIGGFFTSGAVTQQHREAAIK